MPTAIVWRNKRAMLLIWGLVRLPALALSLYLLRGPVLSALEWAFDIARATEYAIALVSTPVVRATFFFLLTLVLLAFWILTTHRFNPIAAYVLMIVATSVLLAVSFHVTGTSKLRALPAMLILATNSIPDQLTERFSRLRGLGTWFMAVGVGVAELFFVRRYVGWLDMLRGGEARPRRASIGIKGVLMGLVLTAGVASIALDYPLLAPLEQMIRMSPQVSIIDTGDFNWIEIDDTGQYLYASGHGLQYLRRYDLSSPSAFSLMSDSETDGAQGFAYDPALNEVYVYNARTKNLLYLDASTLELKRSLPLPEVSPGDLWIAVESRSNTITIVSEADVQIGTPFIVLNRSTGAVLDRRNFDAGNLLMHPAKPIVHLSFFRRTTSLISYDLEQRMVLRETPTNSRVDRMAYWKQANELLLASPAESRVARFDADTLEPKGNMASIFGVRVLVVDSMRNFLLCGSLMTGTVAVFDLTTGQQRANFYLGPWLRTIALDSDNGIAYVSANGGLYKLNYGSIR